MATKLTIKEELFCQKFMELGNATRAYRFAYDCGKMKPGTIHVKASLLQKKDKVRIRLAELQEYYRKKFELNNDRIIEGLIKIALAEPRNLYNEDGSYKELYDIDQHTSAAIEHIEMQNKIDKNGVVTHKPRRITLYNKVNATNLLLRVSGAYQDPQMNGKTKEIHEDFLDRLVRQKEAERKEREASQQLTEEKKDEH